MRTKRPRDQETKRPGDQKTKRPRDQETKRPRDQETKRPKEGILTGVHRKDDNSFPFFVRSKRRGKDFSLFQLLRSNFICFSNFFFFSPFFVFYRNCLKVFS